MLKKINSKFDRDTYYGVVPTGSEHNNENFLLIRNNVDESDYEDDDNDDDTTRYDYSVMRVMKISRSTAIKTHKEKYLNMEIILDISYPSFISDYSNESSIGIIRNGSKILRYHFYDDNYINYD
jgi:hypothetical protein